MSPHVSCWREEWADAGMPLPSYATAGAAGADLHANLPADMRAGGIVLSPGARALVPTGLCMSIPPGWEMQVRPRSGLALKHGITVANAPGTIDSDYRGPVGVLLINLGAGAYTIAHGERVAQVVLAPAPQARFVLSAALDETDRGAGGFGSTGRGTEGGGRTG